MSPMFTKRCAERRQYTPVELLKPLTDKSARARTLQGRLQQGRVWFPETAPWRDQAWFELLRFPGGVHDDVVDALAWCAILVVTKGPPLEYRPPVTKSWRDKLNALIGGGRGSHMAA
jgi:hypothetical protein